jgi:hypothetical protein
MSVQKNDMDACDQIGAKDFHVSSAATFGLG